MSVNAQAQHFQSQAVAMLAIGTATIGFGLFSAEFRVSMEFVPALKFVTGVFVLLCYVSLARSVKNILESGEVTGRDVVEGPLVNLFLIVLYAVSIFVADIFDTPVGDP